MIQPLVMDQATAQLPSTVQQEDRVVEQQEAPAYNILARTLVK